MFRLKAKTKKAGHPDYFIVFCVALLVITGLMMLASASSNLGKTRFGDANYYLKHQLINGLGLGIIGFLLASRIYYRYYEKFALVLLLVSIIFLVLIFTPLGVAAKGATRWLNLGPIIFQPSEIIKLTFVIYLAAWLGRKMDRQKNFWSGFVPFLMVTGFIAVLLLKQPATSTVAILVLTALAVYFASGAKLSYILGTAAVAAIGLLAIVYVTPYRWDRIVSFLDPAQNIQGGGFHLNQALIAIGSGGLTGVGYGQSTTKISFLPEPVGDSIFAIIAEEMGFIGAISLLALFLALVLKTFLLARRCSDRFGQLLLVGFGSLIALQTFFHIGAISGLLPLTGTPLPFISYGGTALAVFMTIGGIIVNISKYA